MRILQVFKHPSAFLPIAMSLSGLALIGIVLLRHGSAPQADEGTAAHLWQMLMAGQLPIIAFFAIKWLPQAPRAAARILGLQLAAGLAAAAPVFLLHW